MKFSKPIPFSEAIDRLQQRRIIPSSARTAQWGTLAAELRERAFFSARVESARLLQSMHDYLGDYLAESRLPDGSLRAQGRAEFVANMRELAMREGLGKVDPLTGRVDPTIRESDLTDIRSLSRLQLIFDTQVESAQEFGYFQQGQNPDILDVFPAQRFIRVRPVNAPRPAHAANEGEVRRKDDLQFWLSMNEDFGVPWGPWGFNSGMGVEDVDRDEAVQLGVLSDSDQVKPIDRTFNAGLQASTRDLDRQIRAALRQATGGTTANGQIRPRQAPANSASRVSSKLSYHPRATRAQKARQDEVLAIIDRVHSDGPLSSMPIRWGKGSSGHYAPGREIKIGASNLWRSQLVHEIGHKLDREGIGSKNSYASMGQTNPEMKSVLQAIKSSSAVNSLKTASAYTRSPAYQSYQLKEVELWARAYTQYVAQESGDPDLLQDIENRRNGTAGYWPDSQWTTADFAPIRKAIRSLFDSLHWQPST